MKSFITSVLISMFLIPSFANAETLSQRQTAFQSLLKKEKTEEARNKKIHSIAMDKKSRFRVDAINEMIDHKMLGSGPIMVTLTKDPQVREFAIYGVGELGVYEATPLLIRYMRDDNRNNRGNAFRALQKLYPRDFNFEFHHDDPEYTRNLTVEKVEGWWKVNRTRLKSQSLEKKSDQEKQEAEERWEKYGKEYLDRPTS